MQLGKTIRKYRKEKGLTQEEMANRLGVTTPAVNKWENENSYPDISLLGPIARLLGISLDILFSFQENLSTEEKQAVIDKFKAAIEALPPVIPSIRKIFVGQNINADEKWDICLESEFDTLDDVKAYAVHPDHVAAAGILKDAKLDRACVDYEF